MNLTERGNYIVQTSAGFVGCSRSATPMVLRFVAAKRSGRLFTFDEANRVSADLSRIGLRARVTTYRFRK